MKDFKVQAKHDNFSPLFKFFRENYCPHIFSVVLPLAEFKWIESFFTNFEYFGPFKFLLLFFGQ
jgi:hypothetical protein